MQITFQMDFNGDEDVFTLNCNMCDSDEDIYISNEDIKLTKSGSDTVISVNVHGTGTSFDDVVVSFQSIGEDGLVNLLGENTIDIGWGSNTTTSITTDLGTDTHLNIYADPDNNFEESNYNNYVFRPIVKKANAYISIATDTPYLDSTYREFLESFVNSVDSESEADYIISVGHKTDEVSQYNNLIMSWYKWGYDTKARKVSFRGKKLDKPYNGVVGTYNPGISKPVIFVLGNDVDGTIAALKRLVSGSEHFFDSSNKEPSVIDNLDLTGIGVYDILHNNDNKNNYREDSNEFKTIVKKVLYDNVFDVSIRTVKTLNTTSYQNSTILRLKHVNSDFSDNYKDNVVDNPKPVVVGNGLWTDLGDLDFIGNEISKGPQNARDTWLIEITGGLIQDGHQSSPNYKYKDLTNYYWPALIAGVQEYTGQNSIDYVGYSNGCRVALDSLANFSGSGKNNAGYYFDYDTGQYVYSDLSSSPVDRFVGVACPGAFEGRSEASLLMDSFGSILVALFEFSGADHVHWKDVYTKYLTQCRKNESLDCFSVLTISRNDEAKISLNTLKYYNEIINSNNDQQPGFGLTLNRLELINGVVPNTGFFSFLFTDNDDLVTLEDRDGIYSGINSNNKNYTLFPNMNHWNIFHHEVLSKPTIDKIREVIND